MGIAIDLSGNVWTSDNYVNSVFEYIGAALHGRAIAGGAEEQSDRQETVSQHCCGENTLSAVFKFTARGIREAARSLFIALSERHP